MSDSSIFTFSLRLSYEVYSVSILEVSVKGNFIKKLVPLLSSDLTESNAVLTLALLAVEL